MHQNKKSKRFKIILSLVLLIFSEICFGQTAKDYFNSGYEKYNAGNYEGALIDYNKAINLNPNYLEAYLYRANIKSLLQDFKGALIDNDKAIRLKPNDAYVYNERATTKLSSGDAIGAMEDVNRAIKLNPNYSEAYRQRAGIKSYNDYEGAKQDYTIAISLDTVNINAYLGRASIEEYKDYEGAIQDFNKAIELKPDFSYAFFCRGNAKYGHAMDVFGKIKFKHLEENPNDYFFKPDISGSLLNYFVEAMKDYSQAIKLDSKYVAAYQCRAKVKSMLDDKRGAILDYDKVVMLNPSLDRTYIETDIIYEKLGDLKTEVGDYNGAILDYTKRIVLHPDNALLYNKRGIAKMQIGDINGACIDWSKAGEFGDAKAYELIKENCNK